MWSGGPQGQTRKGPSDSEPRNVAAAAGRNAPKKMVKFGEDCLRLKFVYLKLPMLTALTLKAGYILLILP
jgi:hypothetical protein